MSFNFSLNFLRRLSGVLVSSREKKNKAFVSLGGVSCNRACKMGVKSLARRREKWVFLEWLFVCAFSCL